MIPSIKQMKLSGLCNTQPQSTADHKLMLSEQNVRNHGMTTADCVPNEHSYEYDPILTQSVQQDSYIGLISSLSVVTTQHQRFSAHWLP